jgi:hypothetical protein
MFNFPVTIFPHLAPSAKIIWDGGFVHKLKNPCNFSWRVTSQTPDGIFRFTNQDGTKFLTYDYTGLRWGSTPSPFYLDDNGYLITGYIYSPAFGPTTGWTLARYRWYAPVFNAPREEWEYTGNFYGFYGLDADTADTEDWTVFTPLSLDGSVAYTNSQNQSLYSSWERINPIAVDVIKLIRDNIQFTLVVRDGSQDYSYNLLNPDSVYEVLNHINLCYSPKWRGRFSDLDIWLYQQGIDADHESTFSDLDLSQYQETPTTYINNFSDLDIWLYQAVAKYHSTFSDLDLTQYQVIATNHESTFSDLDIWLYQQGIDADHESTFSDLDLTQYQVIATNHESTFSDLDISIYQGTPTTYASSFSDLDLSQYQLISTKYTSNFSDLDLSQYQLISTKYTSNFSDLDLSQYQV